MNNPHLTPQAEGEIDKILWSINPEQIDATVAEAKAALARLLLREPVRLTSEDWMKLIDNPEWRILDPDGWDRKNFQQSWYEERITANEFQRRAMYSTLSAPLGDYPTDRFRKFGANYTATH